MPRRRFDDFQASCGCGKDSTVTSNRGDLEKLGRTLREYMAIREQGSCPNTPPIGLLNDAYSMLRAILTGKSPMPPKTPTSGKLLVCTSGYKTGSNG